MNFIFFLKKKKKNSNWEVFFTEMGRRKVGFLVSY